MPNWCTNYLLIKHDDPQKLADLQAKIERAIHAKDDADGFFQQIVPMPIELADPDTATWGGDDEAVARQNAKRAAMRDKYGFASWYDWRIEKWGTKWDVREFNFDHFDQQAINIVFETAWSPPEGIFEALKEQGYHVEAQYIDEGMGFCGEWIDGNDKCYSDRADLPEHLAHLWPEYDEEGELI